MKWRPQFSKTSHLFRRIIAYADGANLALLIKLAQSSGCFLDGNQRIRPVNLVDINIVRLETTERILELLENPPTSRIPLDFAGRPVEANFRGHDNSSRGRRVAAKLLPRSLRKRP